MEKSRIRLKWHGDVRSCFVRQTLLSYMGCLPSPTAKRYTIQQNMEQRMCRSKKGHTANNTVKNCREIVCDAGVVRLICADVMVKSGLWCLKVTVKSALAVFKIKLFVNWHHDTLKVYYSSSSTVKYGVYHQKVGGVIFFCHIFL